MSSSGSAYAKRLDAVRFKRATDEQDHLFKKTITAWINQHLREVKKYVADVYADLCENDNLISLIEVLAHTSLPRQRGNTFFHKQQNVNTVLDFLRKQGVELVNIHCDEIMKGNPKLTLALLQRILMYYNAMTYGVDDTSFKESLLMWSRQTVEGYPEVDIHNFSNSWRNGKAFNAILHRNRPDLLDFERTSTQTNKQNLEMAFSIAERDLGITPLLDPEDVDVAEPDERSLIAYVSSLYAFFQDHPAQEQSIDSDESGEIEDTSGITIISAIDPTSGHLLDIDVAIEQGIIDLENGQYFGVDELGQQKRIPITEAIQQGYISTSNSIDTATASDGAYENQSNDAEEQAQGTIFDAYITDDRHLNASTSETQDMVTLLKDTASGGANEHQSNESEEQAQRTISDLHIDDDAQLNEIDLEHELSRSHRGPRTIGRDQLSLLIHGAERIGIGGFSEVFKVDFKGLTFAVKTLNDKSAVTKEFNKESAVAFLRHPFLLPVLFISVPDPDMFVLPYKSGGDLSRVLMQPDDLPNFCSSWQDFVRMLYQISTGLKYLHTTLPHIRGKIRHGDLKPANILLDRDGNACIGDAGLAVEIPHDRENVTATNVNTSGTEVYIDPESELNKCTENDIYAFGIVLEQMLTVSIGRKHRGILDFMLKNKGRTEETLLHVSKNHQIWRDAPPELRRKLVEMMLQCVLNIKERLSVHRIAFRLLNICNYHEIQLENGKGNASKCAMCHFYRPATLLKARRLECCKCERSRFCRGCLSFSSTNPLFCPSCGECQPPIGGRNLFALLVAGGGSPEDQMVFIRDVNRVRDCLLDPRVVGIREENLYCMNPRLNAKEPLKSTPENVLEQIDNINEKMKKHKPKGQPVFIFYISCHSRINKSQSESGSTLIWSLSTGSHGNELPCEEVARKLEDIDIELMLTIVDCCFAAEPVLPFGKGRCANTNMIQWSACKTNETSTYTRTSGSNFTNCILKGMTSSVHCPNKVQFGQCSACLSFHDQAKQDGFITFGELQEYVRHHFMKTGSSQTPRLEIVGNTTQVKLAYYNQDSLGTKIWFRKKQRRDRTLLLLEKTLASFHSLEPLKSTIASQLKAQGMLDDVDRMATSASLKPRLVFTKITYKGSTEEVSDFDTILQLYNRFDILECNLKPQ